MIIYNDVENYYQWEKTAVSGAFFKTILNTGISKAATVNKNKTKKVGYISHLQAQFFVTHVLGVL